MSLVEHFLIMYMSNIFFLKQTEKMKVKQQKYLTLAN